MSEHEASTRRRQRRLLETARDSSAGRRWAVLLCVVTTAQRLDLDVQGDWMSGRRGTRRNAYGLRARQLAAAADEKVLAETRRQAAARFW